MHRYMKLIRLTAAAIITIVATACTKENKITIETSTAIKGDLTETVTATGTLESVTQVDVGTQVTGKVVTNTQRRTTSATKPCTTSN